MRKERGFLLLAVIPMAFLAAGMVLLSLTFSKASLKDQEFRRHRLTAISRAQAALAVAQARIMASVYEGEANKAIADAMATGEDTGLTNAEGNPVKVFVIRDEAEVWISRLEGMWYQLDSVASVGNAQVDIRVLVRERDSWTRYYAFSDQRPLGLTGISSGYIHSNRYIVFYFPDRTYNAPVTAVEGFYYGHGATAENTWLPTGSNAAADPVPMPDLGAITAFDEHNTAEFRAAWTALGLDSPAQQNQVDLYITLNGTTYDLTTKNPDTGAMSSVTGIPLPSTGVVYVPMDISGLEGTLNGKLTIATIGEITLTGSLQYVDDAGNTAYLNGIPTNPEIDEYQPNPDYSGESVLGIVANGDIFYHPDAPAKMEHNAYFFSVNGSFGVPSGYPLKSTLRRLGGVTTKYSNIGGYLNSSGNVTSGFPDRLYFYDDYLRNNPPPRFLTVEEPVFTAYRLASGAGTPLSSGGATPNGWKLKGRAIGKNKRNNGNGGGNGSGNGNGNGNGDTTGTETGDTGV